MAGEFAFRGNEVRLLVSDTSCWADSIEVYNAEDNLICSGPLALVTSSLQDAVDSAEVIFITYPTFLLKGIADALLPLVEPGQMIGVAPGNDAEFFFAQHVNRGAKLFGLQRVHSIARLKERGKSVYMLGRKDSVQVAAIDRKSVV